MGNKDLFVSRLGKDGKWQRSSFNGKCQVIVQSGKTKGRFHFEALLEGIKLTSLELEVK
jgi:beta-galactosidase